jgi:hypothetical protein
MSKNVANTSNNTPTVQGKRNAFQRYADDNRQSGLDGDFLKFTKQGEWVYGADETELPDGTRLILGINTLEEGWIKWVEQKPVERRMGLTAEGFRPAERSELGDDDPGEWEEDADGKPRDPWRLTSEVQLLNPETGDRFKFSTASKGGLAAVADVSGVYGNRLQDEEDPELVPVVLLRSSSYKNKKYGGKTMVPVFELTDKWVKPEPKKAEPAARKSTAAAASKSNGKAPKALPAPRGSSKGPSRGARV